MSFDNGEKERILRKLLETERNEFRAEAEALASELRAKDAEITRLKAEVAVLERALWSAVGRIVKSGNDCAVRNGGRPVPIGEVVQERKQRARKELEEGAQ
jgi:CRISPR/Cas system-associated exonuclease Cas4 (RecB family)